MRYANNEQGERIEASISGQHGTCPVCGSLVIGRCGEQRVNHWAHKSRHFCHIEKEARTKWHYDWQDQFPKEWQEVITKDEQGEKHIADIKTQKGLVVEFQYSNIKPAEQGARENHYKAMVWVVNGVRRVTDFERVSWNKYYDIMSHAEGEIINLPNAENVFPKNWNGRKVPVCFDFKNVDENDQSLCVMLDDLVILFPREDVDIVGCLRLSRKRFIEMVKDESLLEFLNKKNNENTTYVKQKERVCTFKRQFVREKPLNEIKMRNPYKKHSNCWTKKERADIIKFGVCPTCGNGQLMLRNGKFGQFYGCSNYPACRCSVSLV